MGGRRLVIARIVFKQRRKPFRKQRKFRCNELLFQDCARLGVLALLHQRKRTPVAERFASGIAP